MSDEPCKPGEHSFRTSWETNEPIGRCTGCGASVDWVERQWEESEDLEALLPSETPEPEPSEDLLQQWAQEDIDRIRLADLDPFDLWPRKGAA